MTNPDSPALPQTVAAAFDWLTEDAQAAILRSLVGVLAAHAAVRDADLPPALRERLDALADHATPLTMLLSAALRHQEERG